METTTLNPEPTPTSFEATLPSRDGCVLVVQPSKILGFPPKTGVTLKGGS